MSRKKLTAICKAHYVKLVVRSLFFVAAVVFYIVSRVRNNTDNMILGFERIFLVPLIIIGASYVFEMIARFFPSRFDSMGCQKQFAKNYRPTGKKYESSTPWWRVLIVLLAWVALNGTIGLLHFLGIIDQGILVLIALAYGICDLICILFFCPFQTWFLKNRCCALCRIYNWDFVMMCTPFFFIPKFYTWIPLGLSLALLIRWELTHLIRPERFEECTNDSLRCQNCPEKLCQHKKQLAGFIRKNKDIFFKK